MNQDMKNEMHLLWKSGVKALWQRLQQRPECSRNVRVGGIQTKRLLCLKKRTRGRDKPDITGLVRIWDCDSNLKWKPVKQGSDMIQFAVQKDHSATMQRKDGVRKQSGNRGAIRKLIFQLRESIAQIHSGGSDNRNKYVYKFRLHWLTGEKICNCFINKKIKIMQLPLSNQQKLKLDNTSPEDQVVKTMYFINF